MYAQGAQEDTPFCIRHPTAAPLAGAAAAVTAGVAGAATGSAAGPAQLEGSVEPTCTAGAVAAKLTIAAELAAATASVRLPAQGVSWAQLHQQLSRGSSSINGWDVVWELVRNTPGITADSMVAPVLLTYTSPELLAGCAALHAGVRLVQRA